MAKLKMICPFSKELCKECAIYRGRHYYLCFCEKYRGHLGNPDRMTNTSVKSMSDIILGNRLEISPVIVTGAIDPFGKTLKDIV